MNTTLRIGAYGTGLALAFGAAFTVGHVVGPVSSRPAHAHDMSEHNTGTGGAPPPGGLAVSERGYTLVPLTDPLAAGVPTTFRFRILGPDGAPLTHYQPTHDAQLHLITVRRDLSGYQHVHPTLAADGTWSVPLTFASAGTYRVFADFAPRDDPAGGLTLGADVSVAGDFRPAPLPAPSRTATVDGYTVTLDGDLTATSASMLTLSVARDGHPVTDLQPYLGAYGHLVALRSGDLAYLHVHPQGEPGDGVTPAGPGISFHAQAPSAGSYRLYLDFQHDGVVHTAEFTVTVADTAHPSGASGPGTGAPADTSGTGASAPAAQGHGAHAH